MAADRLGTLLRHIRLVGAARQLKALADAELLHRFEARGDEDAFAALVQRHGGLVLGVCRHVLGHEQDAEDAYQATFLVLARRAGSIRKKASLASWLHAVAYRTAVTMQRASARRRAFEGRMNQPKHKEFTGDHALRELQAILDEELNRLPEKHRLPFVECCLRGHSKAETARLLGWKIGTVSGRLARARKLLRQRLARRGVALSAAICVIEAARGSACAAVPGPLLTNTVRAAALFQNGQAGGLVSASVLCCAERIVRSMALIKIKAALACLLTLGLFAAGSGATGWLLTGFPSAGGRVQAAGQASPTKKATSPQSALPANPVQVSPKATSPAPASGNQGQPSPTLPKATSPRPPADLHWAGWVNGGQVAEELDLTADQLQKVKAVANSVNAKYMDDLLGHRAFDEGDRASALRTRSNDINTAMNTALNEALPNILDPQQLKRLGQIDLHVMKVEAFSDRRVVKALQLADDQKRKIEKVAREESEAISKSPPAPGMDAVALEKVQKYQKKVYAECMSKALALLTPEQRQAWSELVGSPFEWRWSMPPKREAPAAGWTKGWLAGIVLAAWILALVGWLFWRRYRRAAVKASNLREIPAPSPPSVQ